MTAKISLNPNSIAFLLGAVAIFLIFDSSAVVLIHHLTGRDSLVLHKLVKLFYVDLELQISLLLC